MFVIPVHYRPRPRIPLFVIAVLVGGCSQIPTSGPTRSAIEETAGGNSILRSIQVVDVDDRVARDLLSQRHLTYFSDTLGETPAAALAVGSGDALEVNIWEAPPATLFGGGAIDPRTPSSSRATTLPPQTVDRDGYISIPFAGRIHAAGQTLQTIGERIKAALKGKANQPEILVRVTHNASASVTIVGEVSSSVRMPLTASGERLLDALAAAGGVRQPVSKMTLQVTRGRQFQSLPLDIVIRDPRQNVPLQPGDVVTAIFQPLSFTAMGATGKNEEVNFEAQGITLAQALARSGGLLDSRADASGVFIFRFEQPNALDWPRKPVTTTPEGLVPVVYRVDLRNPASFFVMQSFAVNNKDIVYVSNSPVAELQKVLNVIFSVAYPLLNFRQLTE